MGFLAGFTGGAALTLSVTYLALLAHQQNRDAQRVLLRAQTSSLDALLPPAGEDDDLLPPRRNTSVPLPDGSYRPRPSLSLAQQPQQYPSSSSSASASSLVETAKARWNADVVAAARWAQEKDWAAVREDAEEAVARVLGVELAGGSSASSSSSLPSSRREAGESGSRTVPAPAQVREEVRRGVGEAAHRAGDALQEARNKTVDVARAMKDEAREIVEEAKEVVSAGVDEAREKVHDLMGKAKAVVYLAEEKAEAKLDAKLLHISDVDRALAERYDSAKREERMKKSAEEVLMERYIPIAERDNSQLRGI